MGALVAATLLMAGTHLVPGWPGLKARLVGHVGRGPYMAGYSLLSLAALAWLLMAWRAAPPAPSPLDFGLAAKQASVLLMPAALFLILARLTTRPADTPRGIYTLVAAPGSLGVLLWSVLHLASLSDARSAVVFGGFALIAAGSLVKNRMLAPRYDGPVDWRGIGVWRVLLALAAWVLLLALHPHLIGPDPAAYLSP